MVSDKSVTIITIFFNYCNKKQKIFLLKQILVIQFNLKTAVDDGGEP